MRLEPIGRNRSNRLNRPELPVEKEETRSKSQRKREVDELQALGERLVAFSAERITKIVADPELREALLLAKEITQRGALRRQLQYIGRLMRTAEVGPIRHALDEFTRVKSSESATFSRIKGWRDRLVAGEEEVFAELGKRFPGKDLQGLGPLTEKAQKEKELGRPPKAYRELFRVLRVMEEAREKANWQDPQAGKS
jgi:ribosome-associated protein